MVLLCSSFLHPVFRQNQKVCYWFIVEASSTCHGLASQSLITAVVLSSHMKVVNNLISQARISQIFLFKLRGSLCGKWPIANMASLLAADFTNKGQTVDKYEEVKIISTVAAAIL